MKTVLALLLTASIAGNVQLTTWLRQEQSGREKSSKRELAMSARLQDAKAWKDSQVEITRRSNQVHAFERIDLQNQVQKLAQQIEDRRKTDAFFARDQLHPTPATIPYQDRVVNSLESIDHTLFMESLKH